MHSEQIKECIELYKNTNNLTLAIKKAKDFCNAGRSNYLNQTYIHSPLYIKR